MQIEDFFNEVRQMKNFTLVKFQQIASTSKRLTPLIELVQYAQLLNFLSYCNCI